MLFMNVLINDSDAEHNNECVCVLKIIIQITFLSSQILPGFHSVSHYPCSLTGKIYQYMTIQSPQFQTPACALVAQVSLYK